MKFLRQVFFKISLLLLLINTSAQQDCLTSNQTTNPKNVSNMQTILKKFYKDKKVLVTGGAGFIGSHLVEQLVQLGARVTILDNFSSGSLKNLSSVVDQVNVIEADINNQSMLSQATKNKDIVFHLAALVSVAKSVQDPMLCKKINEKGTQALLCSCSKNKVKTVIFSSSSAVYGNHEGMCNENTPTNPLSPYASSKLYGENLCKKYANSSNINTACLRYFNVFGDRQNPQGEYAAVVAKFKHALKNKEPLTIFGDGTQTRDFIHVSKVAEANLVIGMQKNLNGNIFNIGTGKSISLHELIKKLEKELKTKATAIIYKAPRPGDVLHSQADCDKFLNILEKLT